MKILLFFRLGSGKSATMFDNSHGVFKSCINYLLSQNNIECVNVSVIELYRDQFRDILNTGNSKISVDSSGKSIVTSAVKFSVSKTYDLDSLITSVVEKRNTKATETNAFSSRSHLFIILEKVSGSNQLVLADLAGFESTDNKENQSESIAINRSLSHLNKVLLDMKRRLVPNYTGNSLTNFLQPVLKQTKTIVYYHILESSIAKYLNLVDQLLNVKIIHSAKRPANGSLPSIKTKQYKQM